MSQEPTTQLPTILILDEDQNTLRQVERAMGNNYDVLNIELDTFTDKTVACDNPCLLLADISQLQKIQKTYLSGLRDKKWFSQLPLIALSSPSEKYLIEGKPLGAAKLEEFAIATLFSWDYLKKPLHLKILESKIVSALEIKNTLHAGRKEFSHFYDIGHKYGDIGGSILIMEDEQHDAAFLKDILSPQFNVICCSSDKEIPHILSDTNVDLICLDVWIEGEEKGYEVLRWLQESPNNVNTPIVFITGNFTGQDIAKGLAAGACDYITKPFMPGPIRSRLKMHISRYNFIKNLG